MLRLLLLSAAVLTVGCAQVAEDGGFAEVSTLTAARGAPDVVWQRDAALSAEAQAKAAAILAEPLTPASAVEVALLQNPALQAQLEAIGLANADLRTASRPPNPVADFAIRFPEGGGAADIDIGIVANVLSLVTMSSRVAVAQDALQVARLETAQAIVSLVQDVKEAGLRFDAARQELLAAQDHQAVAVAAHSYAQALYNAGNLSAAVMLDHETAVIDAALQVENRLQRVQQAELNLRRVMGLAVSVPVDWWPLPHHVMLPSMAADANNELITAALSQRLDLSAQAQAIEWRAKRAGYAVRWAAWDEAHAGVQLERGDGWALGPSVAIALPIFHRGGAEVSSTRAALRQARQTYAAAAQSVAIETASAFKAYEVARRQAVVIAERLLPLAEESLALMSQEHDYMLKGTFDLLEARQRLGDMRQSLRSAQSEALLAYVQLERALGGSVPASLIQTADMPAAAQPESEAPAEDHQHHHHH